MLRDVQQLVETKYLKNSSEPMFWAAANITRIICAKMMLVIYQPVLFPGPGNQFLSDDVRARLFNAALEVFEYAHILNTDPRCKQWRWLFQTYTQWHAVAYTLIEVTHRPWGPKSERAWAALNLRFAAPNSVELKKLAGHHAVWLPLRKLYDKASKHREAEIVRLKDNPQAAQELELNDRCGAVPTSLRDIPGSVKRAIALDRWRKLINAPPLPEEATKEPPVPLQQQKLPSLPPTYQQPVQSLGSVLQNDHINQAIAAKPELMEYLDSAMSNSTFVTDDFAPLLYGDAANYARNSIFGYHPGDMTPMNSNLDFNTPTPSYDTRAVPGLSLGNPVELQHQHQQPLQQQLDQGPVIGMQTPLSEEQLPPWLWPANGTPEMLRMSYLNTDDTDMNVDEGFDWQMWQESLGRYEQEANGGRASSTWGRGI